MVSWFITDSTGTPVDGAHLTIYCSTSKDGPFTAMPAGDKTLGVEDLIAGVFQNPIVTGHWNPDKLHGLAVADIHLTAISNYFFYAKIVYDSVVEYWPKVDSVKPGDPSWTPIKSNGPNRSTSGYAASGNGLGNGPTTAYPNHPFPLPWPVPEVPFGTIVSFLSMFTVLVGFIGVRRFRQKTR